jgi:hypothetical protein
MRKKLLIIDYDEKRREQLRELFKLRFQDFEVEELATSPPPQQNIDTEKLRIVQLSKPDLLVGHIGGNPSGYECLRVFKEANPKGKAVLYTKRENIPLNELDGLKLADKVFRRSDQDDALFDNADEMFDIIKMIMEQRAVTFWSQPFKDPKVLVALLSLLTAVVGLLVKVAAK